MSRPLQDSEARVLFVLLSLSLTLIMAFSPYDHITGDFVVTAWFGHLRNHSGIFRDLDDVYFELSRYQPSLDGPSRTWGAPEKYVVWHLTGHYC